METQLKEAVKKLAEKAKWTSSAANAMHFTQAALNAANALATLDHKEKQQASVAQLEQGNVAHKL